MKYIKAIAYREYRIRLTNPILPMWDILVPVIYLVVFGASLNKWIGPGAGGVNYPTFFLGGVLGMVTFSIALNSSYAFFEDLQSGIFHELLTYPFPRRDLLFGKLAFNALFSVAGVLCCAAAGVLVLHVPIPIRALPGLLFWTVTGMAVWYFFCSWLSLKARGFNAYHTTTSALYLLLMFVSNLFYPSETLPWWIRWVAKMNPITWQVDLLRSQIYDVATPAQLRIEAAALVGFMLICYVAANRSLNKPIE